MCVTPLRILAMYAWQKQQNMQLLYILASNSAKKCLLAFKKMASLLQYVGTYVHLNWILCAERRKYLRPGGP